MAITGLNIQNFKGIDENTDFKIKPITIFIGKNSSGKSSALHALTCLSQTLKISNSSSPISLDDENAHVHLGRFIEVIHSKSYQGLFKIGVSAELQNNIIFRELLKIKSKEKVVASYTFKCTQRTQEITITEATIKSGSYSYIIKKETDGYIATCSNGAYNFNLNAFKKNGFLFNLIPATSSDNLEILEFESWFLFESLQAAIQNELINTLYLGPFRQEPLRRYPTRGVTPLEVGSRGESTITILANESIQTKARPNSKKIGNWLKKMGLAESIEVKRLATSDLFEANIKLADGANFGIADLGYGISQILPVLTQCSFAKKGSTLIFEQPELHLHEGAAKKLATVFTDTIKEKKCNIIAETHSRELIQQLMQEIKDGNISASDFQVYEVSRENGSSHFKEVSISLEDGSIEVSHPWGKGVQE